MVADSQRILLADKIFTEEQSDEDLSNHLMQRMAAKKQIFRCVDFKYTIFDTCYFHSCDFIGCDFTGCRFTGSNFNSAKFSGCTFDYAVFERTTIDPSVLDNCCPGFDNLKMRFARTLRMNFQELGDAAAVNKAISVELEATESAFLKSWNSNESYYRAKYSGFERFSCFVKYLKFKALDVIWGNGESSYKLLRAIVFVLCTIALRDVFVRHDPLHLGSYFYAAVASPQILLGTLSPEQYSTGYLTFINALRLVIVGFFMAIIIKRFNRR